MEDRVYETLALTWPCGRGGSAKLGVLTVLSGPHRSWTTHLPVLYVR
jgi:hypothetical protein